MGKKEITTTGPLERWFGFASLTLQAVNNEIKEGKEEEEDDDDEDL